MNMPPAIPESDLRRKTKWLILGRFLFSVLLLGSTVVFQMGGTGIDPVKPLIVLGLIIAGLFVFSLIYYLMYAMRWFEIALAYAQILFDTLFVSLIIYVTGGFSSIFSFLYLVVIIYSSILLFRNGSFVVAAFCSVQYAVMIYLEYQGTIKPIVVDGNFHFVDYSAEPVFFKILITIAACFAVAFLSSVLAEQAKRSKDDLLEMEKHVKRVQKMAYLGEMAANLAHEIKNPLASLAGSIQLLREEVDYEPDHDKLMQIALRETNRLSSLVANFLLISKPQAGNAQKINLGRVLSEIVELFEKNNALNEQIDIEADFSPEIYVRIDPDHLKQIIFNLMLNAAESIEGKGLISIEMHPVKNNIAEVLISDNGCGISEDIINSIFDPFFTTKTKGTGLGLSIVLNLLEAYESRLEVESAPTRGTYIRFKLKRVAPTAR
jgi:two-component system sensor histidine kinase PilS (NtrC family)